MQKSKNFQAHVSLLSRGKKTSQGIHKNTMTSTMNKHTKETAKIKIQRSREVIMISFPDKKYNIIYADPAWSYNDKRDKHKRLCGGATVHYETMPMQDIYDLPVESIADENCYLFLWVTFPLLNEAIKTFEKWGFTYKTIGFNWVKTNKKNGKPFFGIGYYTNQMLSCA